MYIYTYKSSERTDEYAVNIWLSPQIKDTT